MFSFQQGSKWGIVYFAHMEKQALLGRMDTMSLQLIFLLFDSQFLNKFNAKLINFVFSDFSNFQHLKLPTIKQNFVTFLQHQT